MIKTWLTKLSLYKKRLKYGRKNQLQEHFAIGKNVTLRKCHLGDYTRIANYAAVNNTSIGDYSAIGRYSKITHSEIGKFCAISWDCSINAISHPYDHLSISAFAYVPYVGGFVEKRVQTHQKVIIKNDVWIGANSVIMPGVTIGNGAIIGAGAVVTKDVPDYAIVVGVPAKILRYRFDETMIATLLELKWWDQERDVLQQNIELWQRPLDQETLEILKAAIKA